LVDDELETVETYSGLLAGFAARSIPMICANPDLVVERGGKIISCAGSLAAVYAQLGGQVAYAGKPHRPIYDLAFATVDRLASGSVSRQHVLAIGDGIHTDIAGAATVGIRSVFIASGVHVTDGHLDAKMLAKLFPDPHVRPMAAMTQLVW
jgi:HAD superfamily hydrolase (TIGR01459 family)